MNYSYYLDRSNKRSFGKSYFGLQSKNLIKQKSDDNRYWEKYTYEFDSSDRPIKEIKTTMTKMTGLADSLVEIVITDFSY
jgi:hypothetical protein